jgi:hypothetical protein
MQKSDAATQQLQEHAKTLVQFGLVSLLLLCENAATVFHPGLAAQGGFNCNVALRPGISAPINLVHRPGTDRRNYLVGSEPYGSVGA